MTGLVHRLVGVHTRAARLADAIQPIALLGGRLLVARAFLLSGLTKWNGLSINESTFTLFQEEFFGKYNLPDGLVNLFAVGAAVGEIVLPLLLAMGLFTRWSALGLLAMTLVIQVFVYPDAWWNVHAWWTAVLVLIIAFGPGALSADRALGLDGKK
jgi:putative oxidoreductase